MKTGVARARILACLLVVLSSPPALAGGQEPLSVLAVPFIAQSELLCGGAAAAMVLRYWGERGLTAESFTHLVDRSSAGIRTTALVSDLTRRGWDAVAVEGTGESMAHELARGRPVLTLIQDRPGTFHYIVVVAASERGVIFHDPARAPFRVMSQDEFARRWERADRWMAVVVPGSRLAGATRDAIPQAQALRAFSSSCDHLVADGVRQAQEQDLAGAEMSLTSALSCPGSAALRELAGVRVLQKRWPDVGELASAAVLEDPRDEHAWRLLATSRFIENDPVAALAAWNRVGEPRLDIVRVDGLTRTRPRIVERLIGAESGDLLTPARLARARRRLSELPAVTTTRLDFVPVPPGLAELRAHVAERSIVPSDPLSYVTLGLVATVTREVTLAFGSLTGGGEGVGAQWRFWPGRPRVAVDLEAPAPWGGVWGVGAFGERQPFDSTVVPTSERRGARLAASNWATQRVRWTLRGGVDRWTGTGTFGVVGAGLRIATTDDRVTGQVDVDAWAAEDAFGVARFAARARSSSRREGFVVLGTLGGGVAGQGTPADLWFAGDTGNASPITLRAHPLVDDGRFRASQLGRTVVHGAVEAQRWWRVAVVRVGAAVFVDSARAGRRRERGPRGDVDVGGGARLSVSGRGGVFRIDLAKGLRDGATTLSFVYEP